MMDGPSLPGPQSDFPDLAKAMKLRKELLDANQIAKVRRTTLQHTEARWGEFIAKGLEGASKANNPKAPPPRERQVIEHEFLRTVWDIFEPSRKAINSAIDGGKQADALQEYLGNFAKLLKSCILTYRGKIKKEEINTYEDLPKLEAYEDFINQHGRFFDQKIRSLAQRTDRNSNGDKFSP